MVKSWEKDPYPDGRGNVTIRPANGTPTGDVHVRPIATVYTDATMAPDERAKRAAFAALVAEAPELLQAVIEFLNIVEESDGVAAFHINGEIAKWDEFGAIDEAREVLANLDLEAMR